jgi:hypothetical protein
MYVKNDETPVSAWRETHVTAWMSKHGAETSERALHLHRASVRERLPLRPLLVAGAAGDAGAAGAARDVGDAGAAGAARDVGDAGAAGNARGAAGDAGDRAKLRGGSPARLGD